MTTTPQGMAQRSRIRGLNALKKVFCTLSVLSVFATEAADAALLELTPADYSAVFSLDLRRAAENPVLRDILATPDAGGIPVGEDTGLRLSDLSGIAVFNWDDCWYGAFRLNSAARLRGELERRCADGSGKVVRSTVAGRQVYRFVDPKKRDRRSVRKELCLVFSGNDVAIFAKAVELENFLKARRADAKTLDRLGANGAEAWGEYLQRDGAESDIGKLFDSRLKRIVLDLKLAGGDKSAVELSGRADFTDAESARSMSMTIPGIAAFLTGLSLADDPESGDMIVKALRCEVRGSSVLISLHADRELFGRFIRGLKSFFSDESSVKASVPTGKAGAVK